MKPTLLPGDNIITEEISIDKLCYGDVIVYDNPENIRLNIIHRIIGCDSEGLITRGDNNSMIDPYRVRAEHRPLKVVAFERNSQRLPIPKYSKYKIFQKKYKLLRRKILYPTYAFIADSQIFYPLGKMFNTELREFKRPKGVELQLFLGKRRIGIFDSEAEKWQIRFPWKLFIKDPEQ
jgi:hypothetical protein